MSGRPDEWPPERIQRMLDFWAAGKLSMAEIGHEIGVSKNAVAGKLKRCGAQKRGNPVATYYGPPMTPAISHRFRYWCKHGRMPEPPRKGPAPKAARRPGVSVWYRPTAFHSHTVTCCWPVGMPGTRAFRFCDDPIVRGRPYCAAHCDRAYVRRPEQVAA